MSRNKFLRLCLGLAVAVIIGRLFVIQILEHDLWEEKALAQQTLQNVIPAKRGEIYMMDGSEPSPVVMNTTVYTVIVDPMMADREAVEAKLTDLLGEKRTVEWNDAFANRALRYYVVGKNVERKVAEQIREAELDGVWLQGSTKRVYPEGTLAAAVLGFVNAEGKGQYGIEGAMNDILTGKDGMFKTVKDVNNVALSIGDSNVKEPAQDGENVVLTLDKTLQYNVEKIIAEKSKELGFANVSALVMNPQNGQILAMANYPNYDPADFGNVAGAAAYLNHVVDDAYEPASVCKIFTFAAGAEYGLVTPDKTFVNEGVTYVDGWPIKNAEQGPELLGTQTLQIALNYSLNTGSTQVLRWLGGDEVNINATGRERLYDMFYNKFGLGQPTGVELFEAVGQIVEPNAEAWGLDSTYANMTFGQNLQFTMLQVAAAFSSLVNGGMYYTPTIVAGKMQNGEFIKSEERLAVRRTVSEQTSAMMREMLYGTRRAWRANGTDKTGYVVGGKTGTAQVIRDGAYSMNETTATYIGYGGTEGEIPEYVIMVRMWEDGKMAGGQDHALPTFNAIKNYVQDYLRIRPRVAEETVETKE